MAFTRSHLYNEMDQQISFFARALSHPARVAIIRQLYKGGTYTVESLLKLHPLSQPSISQHLSILRKTHLVAFEEKFPYTRYSLNIKNYKKAKKLLKSYLDSM